MIDGIFRATSVTSRSFSSPLHRRRRGGILISVLAFSVITAVLLAGITTSALSYLSRASTESYYAGALDITEAGINTELRKISTNANNVDQYNSSTGKGVTYTFGNGSYTIYCTNKDGTTPWVAPNDMYILCTGTLNGVSRSLKVMCKGVSNSALGKYSIYMVDGTNNWSGTALTTNGDVGTNALLGFTGHPTINGSIYFNGYPTANWSGSDPGSYTENKNPSPIIWPTVDALANQQFPGGLTYLATHNDNARARPAIVGNSISGSTTLVGPGNYYLTSISLTGQNVISLDNTNGAVNIWIGPDGAGNEIIFKGGTAVIPRSVDSSKICNIFVATKGGISLRGSSELDSNVYCYNKDANGNPYGNVDLGGVPTINGQVLGDTVTQNGNVTVNYIPGAVKPVSYGASYYGFANSWAEQSGM